MNDLVLEIGAGHRPTPRADVLVDKDLADDAERGGPLRRDRPLVIADGEALPFRDGAFARSVGRQVMEHMRDVEAFFAECARVSRGGYLSAPSALRERLFGWPYHHWVFALRDGELLCAKKPADFSPLGRFAHEAVRSDRAFRRFVQRLPLEAMHVQLHWEGSIPYRVVDAAPLPDLSTAAGVQRLLSAGARFPRPGEGPLSDLKALALRTLPGPALRAAGALRALRWSGRRRLRRSIDLASLVVCPACKGDVARSTRGYGCAACALDFPVIDGVPHFLLPARTSVPVRAA